MTREIGVLLLLWPLAACKPRPATPDRRPAIQEPKRVIPMKGFDSQGEPELREMPDGSLELGFNFMPPSWAAENDKAWDKFPDEIAREIGVPVLRDDRDLMLIRNPRGDTVARLQSFLSARGKAR